MGAYFGGLMVMNGLFSLGSDIKEAAKIHAEAVKAQQTQAQK